MTITAIILNYKNYPDVRECVLSLERQSLPKDVNFNILIIDNGSNDDCTKKLQREFPQNRYIYNSENHGFAKGINQGIKIYFEKSDYFLLVNNDALLESNCVNLMCQVSNKESLVGPAIYYKDRPDIIWQGGGFFSKLKMGINVQDKNRKLKSPVQQDVDFISGCVFLIPKKIINLIGYFDEKFFFYGEDLDFCLRAKKKNIKVIYHPKAQAWHNIKQITESRMNPFVLKNLGFSYFLIIRKHFQYLLAYGIFLFIFIYTPFRIYQIIIGKNNLHNIFAWFDGGIKGLNIKI